MNIIVCVKYSYDVQQIKFDPKTREPMLAAAPKKIGDMDRRALEEAIRIKEKMGGTVRVLSIGPPRTEDVAKEAYAMGADEVIVVSDEKLKSDDPNVSAKVLAELIKKYDYDIILCGAASTDGYNWQVAGKIAAILDLPFLPNTVSMEIADGSVVAECDLDDAVYKYKATLPAVVSVSLEINEPRIPTLSAILKASRKQYTKVDLSELGVDVAPEISVSKISVPEVVRKRIVMDASEPEKIEEAVTKLLDELKKEGVLR